MMQSNPWRHDRAAQNEVVIPPGLVQQWIAQQHELAARVKVEPYPGLPRFVAGADAAFSPGGEICVAVAIVWDREKSELVEHVVARRPVEYPYVPTFLSFREGPALQEAIALLRHPWEVICLDGQGLAHPRGCGIATHIGVTLGRPAIGVGKSRLCGHADEPGPEVGAWSSLIYYRREVGIVLRTRNKVKTAVHQRGASHGYRLGKADRIGLRARITPAGANQAGRSADEDRANRPGG